MVIPACARTSFSPSSSSLISSSIFSGTFPVFGSMPMRPARYSVSPNTIPSLKGAFTNLFGSLIALRSNCPDDCAPYKVKLPAITSKCRSSKKRLECDPPNLYEIQRRNTDQYPQKHALRQRAPTDFLQRRPRYPSANQKKRYRQAKPSQLKKHLR